MSSRRSDGANRMGNPRLDGGTPPALGWRMPSRLAMAAAPMAMTLWVLAANVTWSLKAVIAITLIVSAAAPAYGLLLVALTAPLGQLFAPAIAYPEFRIAEAIVIAFLAGWLARGLPDRQGPRVPAAIAGGLFAAAILASIAGLAWQLRAYPADFAVTIDQLTHIYFFVVDRIGVVDGARLLEGIGLATASVMLFRQKPALAVTLPVALAVSASLAALSSVLLWRGIGSAAALARYRMIGYRVSGHVGDVNAAGSYFGMIACLAIGMALHQRGRRRVMWLGFAAVNGAGLWLSDSRSALGAAGAVMIVAAFWAATSRLPARSRAAALAIVLLGLLGGAAIRARFLQADPEYRGVGLREQFNATSVRMIGERPLFGVGVGRYYPMSPLFLSPQLAWTYGFENAHNYFLQLGGELGLVGLGLFLGWIGAPIARAGLALARTPRDGRLLGAAGGVVVFLTTCVTGHPFLIGEVAYPFWIQFGLMTGLAGSTLLNQSAPVGGSGAVNASSVRRWLAAAAAIAILAGSPAMTARTIVSSPASPAIDGFYPWETLDDGTRFRWTGAYASLFVPADVTRVEIPVRLPTDGRSIRPMGVEVMTASVDRGRTMVDATWAILSLPLPPVAPPMRFKRIDLRIDRVWQPALYIAGNADLRAVGVQVGEPRLFRD